MFRRFLGLDRNATPDPRLPVGEEAEPVAGSAAETATARRIVARLDALPPEEARYLACFAYVMSRAAAADFDISDEETALMEQFAIQFGGLDSAQAVLVVQMAKIQARVHGATEDFVVTREFRTSRRSNSGSRSSAAASRSGPRTGRSRPRRRPP